MFDETIDKQAWPASRPMNGYLCQDRSQQRRFEIRQTVHYRILDRRRAVTAGRGITLNFSSGGVAFTTEDQLPNGRKVEVLVDWPAKLDGHCALRFVGIGRVVRSDGGWVAVKIQRHEFRTQAKILGPGAALDNDLPSEIPIALHETIAGVGCSGCIIVRADDINVQLQCNGCGAIVGVMHIDILHWMLGRDLLRELLHYRTAVQQVRSGGIRWPEL